MSVEFLYKKTPPMVSHFLHDKNQYLLKGLTYPGKMLVSDIYFIWHFISAFLHIIKIIRFKYLNLKFCVIASGMKIFLNAILSHEAMSCAVMMLYSFPL